MWTAGRRDPRADPESSECMADSDSRRGARSGSEHSLVREVRWQLFRRDELPSRLRRLQRLEEIAEATPHRNGSDPRNEPEGR